ncbi:hypothetical protein CSKR_114091 [Clonorchis sinensis]|nr:hypothetical protein CSKR_114091 [Clonorchis sinensis]
MDDAVEKPVGSRKLGRLATSYPEVVGIGLFTGYVLFNGMYNFALGRNEVASRMMRWRIYGQASAIGLAALIALLSFRRLHGTEEAPNRNA